MPMLPLFTGGPPPVDYSQTITDPIGVTDGTAFTGPVNWTVTVTDSIGVTDVGEPTAILVQPLPLPPIVIQQAALVRAHYW
jgi:hypothetical protein